MSNLPISDWATVNRYIDQWLQDKNKINRELAAKHLYGAMLNDAIAIVYSTVDKFLPLARRRDPEQMAASVVTSVFGRNGFTTIIERHDESKGRSRKTFLNELVKFKIKDHLKKRIPGFQVKDLPFECGEVEEINTSFAICSESLNPEQLAEISFLVLKIQSIIEENFSTADRDLIHRIAAGYTSEEIIEACAINEANFFSKKRATLMKLRRLMEEGNLQFPPFWD